MKKEDADALSIRRGRVFILHPSAFILRKMAIQTVTELFEDRSVRSAGISDIETDRTLLIITNNYADNGLTILGAFPGPGPVLMPALYDPHPSSDKLTCRSVEGRQVKGPVHWHFIYHYSSSPIPREIMDREIYPNPLDRPARATGKAQRYSTIPETWRFITAGTPAPEGAESGITTSAGVAYDSLKEIDDSRWTFHFEKNYPADSFPDWLINWDPDSVNSTECFLLGQKVAKRTLKIAEPQFSDVRREHNIDYQVISFDLDYNALTWDYTTVDRGFHYLKSGVVTKIVLTNATSPTGDGTAPTTPILLDGSGGILASPSSATAIIRAGVVYPDNDFNFLPINETRAPTFVAAGDE